MLSEETCPTEPLSEAAPAGSPSTSPRRGKGGEGGPAAARDSAPSLECVAAAPRRLPHPTRAHCANFTGVPGKCEGGGKPQRDPGGRRANAATRKAQAAGAVCPAPPPARSPLRSPRRRRAPTGPSVAARRRLAPRPSPPRVKAQLCAARKGRGAGAAGRRYPWRPAPRRYPSEQRARRDPGDPRPRAPRPLFAPGAPTGRKAARAPAPPTGPPCPLPPAPRTR